MTIYELLSLYGTCCGQPQWVYMAVRVEASHQDIQFLIGNFSVLIFSVILQALFYFLLLLSAPCGGNGWQVSLCGRRKGTVTFIKYA